jgi:DDE domain
VVLEALLPAAWHRTDQYANNRIEADHGRLKARLRPTRGLKHYRSARVIDAAPGGWRWRSTSWPWRSDPERGLSLQPAAGRQNATPPAGLPGNPPPRTGPDTIQRR